MATYFYVTNDLRTDVSSISELAGFLNGRYISYDSTTGKFSDVSSIVDPSSDRIIPINIWNFTNPSDVSDYIVDPSADISKTPTIDISYHGDYWHAVSYINIKRNRAFYELFNCTNKFVTKEPIGYNTSVRLNEISGNVIYATDPFLYTLGSDGMAAFYFAPNDKAGWMKCFNDDDYDKASVLNPDYDSKISEALAPCDSDGWRQVLNAKFYGFEFNFYPNGCAHWFTLIEGLGHNIKVRYLDSSGAPLPYSAWYPSMTIKSGVGNYSEIGANLRNVAKVEARFVI